MRHLKTFVLTACAVGALCAGFASGAAAYEWQVNGSPVSEPVKVESTAHATFSNRGTGEEFTCTIVSKGSVTTGGKGEITSVTSSGGAKAIPCTLVKSGGCEANVELEAAGLPWSTELATVEGALRDKLTAGHEWNLKCKAIGGSKLTTTCGVVAGLAPHNVAGGVEQVTDGATRRTTCGGLGGAEALQTSSSETLAPTLGGTLSYSPHPLEWLRSGASLTSSVATEWSGTVKLGDPGSPSGAEIAVTCTETGEGTANIGSWGEVAKLTFSGCSGTVNNGKSKCETASMSTIGAPWHTELATVGETTRLLLDPAGTPGYESTCKYLGIKITDECTGTIRPTLTNGPTGVSAAFNTSEKLNCTREKTSNGYLEGTQTIKTPSGKLEYS